jgi:hypothetical protein
LTIQVSESSFLQIAAENGFDFDGKWLVMGRQGSSDEAQISNSNGWLILRGVAEAGCDSRGTTVLCEEYRVVAKHKDDDRVATNRRWRANGTSARTHSQDFEAANALGTVSLQ